MCLVILMSCFSTIGCESKQVEQQKIVKIGVMGPLTGEASAYGQNVKKGIEVARWEIEENGLLKDTQLQVVYEDHQCSPKEGVSIIKRLIDRENINIFINEACSSVALSVSPIAEENKALLVLSTASNYKLKSAGDYIFRIFPSDADQGRVVAERIFQAGHFKTSVIHINNDYGLGLGMVFEQEYEKLGGNVLSSEVYDQDETDFKTLLSKIQQAQPEAVFMATHTETGALILKQKALLAMDIPIYSSEALKDQIVLDVAGTAAEGIKIIFPAQIDNQRNENFQGLYMEMFGKEPESYSVYGYDALKVIAYAIEKAGSVDVDEIKKVLYDTHDYHGASGLINFDEDGEVVGKEYEVWEVKEGEFVKVGK